MVSFRVFFVSIHMQIEENVVTISVSGSFDIGCYESFNASYRPYLTSSDHEFIIDMTATDYIDSSALGMLLLLRERTGGDKGRVLITNVGESAMRIFKVANFKQLFNIQEAKATYKAS